MISSTVQYTVVFEGLGEGAQHTEKNAFESIYKLFSLLYDIFLMDRTKNVFIFVDTDLSKTNFTSSQKTFLLQN
jgi:hypothetical protein